MAISFSRLRSGFFLLLHALLFALLFWLVINGAIRDPEQIRWWILGGTATGVASGLVWLFVVRKRKIEREQSVLLASIVFLEFILGLLLIAPWVWINVYFTPKSNLHSICCETPKDYGATEFESLRIPIADGAIIAGWYVPPTSQRDKAVILIHGYGYDRRGTDFQTRILIEAGYGVLLYDLRNHGESSGPLNRLDFIDTYQQDLQQVIHVLRAKPGIEHIGIVGISLGSFTTLNLPASQLNQFSGLWLDGLRFENFGAQESLNNPLDYLDHIFDTQTRWLAGILHHESITPPPPLFTQIIPTITRPPVMLVASGKDLMERQTNERFIPLLGSNKELWIIENAWHIGGRFDAPEEYKARLLAFFAKAFENSDAGK
jgi:uncharacterized protein